MNIGPDLFNEIVDRGHVKVNEDRKLLMDNVKAWQEEMRKGDSVDIRDSLLIACRNSSWVHQHLMTPDQLRSFLEIINSIKAKYIEITNDTKPGAEIMAEAVAETIDGSEDQRF